MSYSLPTSNKALTNNTNNMEPIIGITLSYDDSGLIKKGVEYGFIRKEYGREVRKAGGVPIFLDESIDATTVWDICDGVIISGGQDIDPRFYGQKPSPYLGKTEPTVRTEWEREVIDECDRAGKHILGICYGSQLLNVHYGGTLFQDIAHEQGSTASHEGVKHDVTFEEDALGFVKGQTVPIASRHHQAVKDLAPGFCVVATAPDGVIEAIKSSRHYGFQWHSESDGTAAKIYRSFVTLCSSSRSAAASSTEVVTELIGV
jgi:putative glutamine amidotransferase